MELQRALEERRFGIAVFVIVIIVFVGVSRRLPAWAGPMAATYG
jgi:hypothetical protein